MVARFSAPVQTVPGAYPASFTMGTGSFPGVKRPGRGADDPPPSQRRGHERIGLYLYSPSGSSWPVIGRTFTFTFIDCGRAGGDRVRNPARGSGFFYSSNPPATTPAVKDTSASFSLCKRFPFAGVKAARAWIFLLTAI